MHEVEVFVLVGESGDYSVGASQDAVVEAWDTDIGGSEARRMVRVVLKVPVSLPTLTGTVPAEGDAELSVA